MSTQDPTQEPIARRLARERGRRIRDAREAIGLTQGQLAEQIGAGRVTVVRWEQGHQEPSLAQALALAEALGASVDEIFAVPDAVAERVADDTRATFDRGVRRGREQARVERVAGATPGRDIGRALDELLGQKILEHDAERHLLWRIYNSPQRFPDGSTADAVVDLAIYWAPPAEALALFVGLAGEIADEEGIDDDTKEGEA